MFAGSRQKRGNDNEVYVTGERDQISAIAASSLGYSRHLESIEILVLLDTRQRIESFSRAIR